MTFETVSTLCFLTRKNHEILCLCEIFCDHHSLKTQFLFYFLIVCHEIHVKLIYINSRWIETIIYRMTLNEMFACNFLIHVSCLNFVEMFQWFIFRSFWSACMLKYDEIFCFTCNRRMFRVFNSCSHVQILSKCLQRFAFRNLRSYLHVRMLKFCLINICFEMSFIKMFDQVRFTSKTRSEIVSHERFYFYNFVRFTIFSYWLWDVSQQSVRSEHVSHDRHSFFFCEMYSQSICFFMSMRVWFIKNS